MAYTIEAPPERAPLPLSPCSVTVRDWFAFQVIAALGRIGVASYIRGDSEEEAARGAAFLAFLYALCGALGFFFIRTALPETRGSTMVI